MLPFREKSSDSDPAVDGTPTDTVVSPTTVAHPKPSLRILDNGPATREEDLLHGPLLLHIGDGVASAEHEHEIMHLPSRLDAGLERDGSNQVETSRGLVSASLPLRMPPEIPRQTMSLSESSDAGGGSFSLPTEGTISTNQYADHEIRTQHSTSRDISFGLFPWRIEVTWEDCRVYRASEPISTSMEKEKQASTYSLDPIIGFDTTLHYAPDSYPKPKAHPIECLGQHQDFPSFLLYGIDGSVDSCDTYDSQLDLDAEIASDSASSEFSCSASVGGSDIDASALDSTAAFIARNQTIKSTVMLVYDHFVRSYAPQRTGAGSKGTSSRSEHYAADGTGSTSRRDSTQKRPITGRHGRSAINGGGESEESDSQTNRHRSSSTTGFKDLLNIVCPYLRWKPQLYEKLCMRKIKTITHLKQHIKKAHRQNYCSNCYMLFGKREVKPHFCQPRSTAPAGLLTTEMVEELGIRADRSKGLKEQWYHVYTVLLPGQLVDFRPFWDDTMSKAQRRAENYIRSNETQKFIKRVLGNAGHEGIQLAKIRKDVCEGVLPIIVENLYSIFASGGKECSPSGELAAGDYETAEPAPGDQDPASTLDSCALQRMDNDGLQRFSDSVAATVSYPTFELEGQSASSYRLADDQPMLERFEACVSTATTGLDAYTWDVSAEDFQLVPEAELLSMNEGGTFTTYRSG